MNDQQKQDKREECLYMAKLSEQTERFEEMVANMKEVIKTTKELKDEERNLLSIAYKNSVGQRRTAWRALTVFEMKEKTQSTRFNETIDWYKKKIEQELQAICVEILLIIDKSLMPNSQQIESKIFYLKMKGDYNRYLSEFTHGTKKKEYMKRAEEAYLSALEKLKADNSGFTKINPLLIGVALNCSVFYYEIKNDLQKACDLAQTTFDEALQDIQSIDEDQYKDATTILQLLNDNLTAWQAELKEVF
ncbi:14-3-3 domain [Pseudocohnilembus persalinus]|uniref:14-3-3 domain n=1 Tax=Pseudocohnilembus persalinus TaxID=266149 RepID=A0A0V0QLW1_PSEPJ|nr:14-3-3 domain [Pseudocohnilembus persalinus]|eukprot:KRX03162.1 14-3-3 domain [Pseudocohnilembus persalinus]